LNRIIARAPLALALALVAPVAGLAQTSTGSGTAAPPAWEAFKKANESIKDYTETITSHEIKGSNVQDRVYHFAFAKPAFARSAIVSGPGSGGEAVWTGGDHVRGHQGGFLKMIKLSIPIDDSRATDLRGKTIDAAFFPTIIASFDSGGTLTEEPGPIVDGVPTDAVSHVPADPTKVRGLTKDVFLISRTTHLPVEHLGYEGSQLVEDDKFTDQKINPGLPPSTFEM
jgi:hypothetical protein